MYRKKIVFMVGKLIIGGMEKALIQLLEELKKYENLEIIVVGHIKDDFFKDWFQKNSKQVTFFEYSYYNVFNKIKRIFYPPNNLYNILKTADIIICYRTGHMQEVLRNFTCKKIAWIHIGFDIFLQQELLKEFSDWDKIVCLTKSFKDDFIKTFPEHADKIVHIYNAIFYDQIKEQVVNLIAPKEKYFVTVTRVNKDKDIATVIHAFDKFWRDNNFPEVFLYIIGDGKMRKQMEGLARSMQSKNKIIFTGTIYKPFGYMQKGLANILSSRHEGLSLSLVEGMAVGALNVASDCKSGPREVLLDGEAGILFPVGNIDYLAKILTDIYHEKIDRKKIIENGFNSLNRFDPQTVTEQVVGLLNSI